MIEDFFQNGKWIDGSSNHHDLLDVLAFIKQRNSSKIFIGCDSHLRGNSYIFALVIALHSSDHGGKFFFKRKKEKDKKRLNNSIVRLTEEVNYAVALGALIQQHFPKKEIHIHLDLNPNEAYLSSKVVKQATSYASAMGFIPTVKPEAWASSTIADSKAK